MRTSSPVGWAPPASMEVSRAASMPVEDATSMMDSLSCPRYLASLEPKVCRSMAMDVHHRWMFVAVCRSTLLLPRIARGYPDVENRRVGIVANAWQMRILSPTGSAQMRKLIFIGFVALGALIGLFSAA